MKKISVSTLNKRNYSVDILVSLDYPRKNHEIFSCIKKPKKVNHLVYLKDCSAIYTLKNGDVLTADCGDVIYTPTGSGYTSDFSVQFKSATGITPAEYKKTQEM